MRPTAQGEPAQGGLTAHVLTSVGWFGGALTVAFCGLAAATTNNPTLGHAFYQTIESVPWLAVPLGLLAVATGALLGLGTQWGIVRHWWVVAKIGIAAVVIVTDAVVTSTVAHDAATAGPRCPGGRCRRSPRRR